MFGWLRAKLRRGAADSKAGPSEAPPASPVAASAPMIQDLRDPSALLGRWVWQELPWDHPERFLGYVYLDAEAGLSAKGGPESAADLAEMPSHTLRMPMPKPARPLTAEEVAARGLPAKPSWLTFYGPQPDPAAPWRTDPALGDCFHESFPDDLQVLVHDGEPRRTRRPPELCWVRVVGAEPGPLRRFLFDEEAMPSAEDLRHKYQPGQTVYLGTLLNAPHGLQSVKEGDQVRFLAGGGLEQPLLVTPQYLDERRHWRIGPCKQCGMGECLDPPSVMVNVRFPDRPEGSSVAAFTAFCAACGGVQLLSRDEGSG